MDQDALKRKVAQAALVEIEPSLSSNSVIGVGTGSTVNFFIELLADVRSLFHTTVSSSQASTNLLRERNVPVTETHNVEQADVYVDGADEVDSSCALIKGGGGALTQEKIVASISERFICIVDHTKVVDNLGRFPLPIEVVPAAQRAVSMFVRNLGGTPMARSGMTENGNVIVDVGGLVIDDPDEMEHTVNNIAGVVTVGIFATHRPSLVLIAGCDGTISRRTPL